METARIKDMIERQFADPQTFGDLRKLVAEVAERLGANPTDADLATGSSFVCNYIEQVPYMLTVAWTSAKAVGLQDEITSILEMVQSYWIEAEDVIPDNLGVFGLLDDAYCSLSSLQAVSDHYRRQTGKHLFPDDLTAVNAVMRKIIGEPFAAKLDTLVGEALKDARVETAVKLLACSEGRKMPDSHATIWNHGPVSELPVSQLKGLGLVAD